MTTSTADFLSVPLSELLVDTHDVAWRLALCAAPDEDPEDWFPFPTDDFTHAAQVCARCPIRAECVAWGRQNRMTGVWGGVRLVGGRDNGTAISTVDPCHIPARKYGADESPWSEGEQQK